MAFFVMFGCLGNQAALLSWAAVTIRSSMPRSVFSTSPDRLTISVRRSVSSSPVSKSLPLNTVTSMGVSALAPSCS